MTCAQLRQQLQALAMDSSGNKPQLVARLEAAQAAMAHGGPAAAAAGVAKAGGSSSSEDEVDRAEEKLAGNLSGWLSCAVADAAVARE
jgi:hypothetical protein